MSNLSKRVEESKQLKFNHNHRRPGEYGTWGRENDPKYGTKHYQIQLSHTKNTVCTPDGNRNIVVLQIKCTKDVGSGILSDCPGNKYHTVCYHGIGALYQSFKDSGKLISFFETYETAIKLAFGGKVVKIASLQGPGFLWATIKDWPTPILSAKENINLMRGAADDEGID